MKKSNNNHARGFFSNALGVAKKLSHVGIDLVRQNSSAPVLKQTQLVDSSKTIEGTARPKAVFEANQYDHPQDMLRNHVPFVTQELLGRHYNTVSKVANLVAPQISDKISDYFFDRLNQFSNNISSVDSVLDQAGIQDLEELTQDVNRSKRLSQALVEQNKWIASLQGALTGATGVIGSSIDIPASLILSLRTIYQVGRSYGFDLNTKEDQDVVQYIFKQINLGALAEKHALLVSLKNLSDMLQVHDIQQLQQLLGSSNDIETLKKWMSNEQGELKWEWLNHFPKVSSLTKLRPVVGAAISATYSWKLVEDVNNKAQEVFSHAREYLITHKETSLSAISAYEKSLQLITQSSPKFLVDTTKNHAELEQSKNFESEKKQIESKENLAEISEVESESNSIEGLGEQAVETDTELKSQERTLSTQNKRKTRDVTSNQVVTKSLETNKKAPTRRTRKKTVLNDPEK